MHFKGEITLKSAKITFFYFECNLIQKFHVYLLFFLTPLFPFLSSEELSRQKSAEFGPYIGATPIKGPNSADF